MSNPLTFIRRYFGGRSNSLARELEAMEHAKAEGIACKVALFNRALREGDAPAILQHSRSLEQYLDVIGAASSWPARLQGASTGRRYLPTRKTRPSTTGQVYSITSATLAHSLHLLTRTSLDTDRAPEWMLAVTGLRRDNLRTLEQLIDIKLDGQSAVRASFDMQAFTQAAVTLHNHGQALHGIFHSHRFSGHPSPSHTDWHLQDLLDQGGYPCIQAIFSEDGFVRFFARRGFTIEIHGKGVETIDHQERLYRIICQDILPYPGNPSPEEERGTALLSI